MKHLPWTSSCHTALSELSSTFHNGVDAAQAVRDLAVEFYFTLGMMGLCETQEMQGTPWPDIKSQQRFVLVANKLIQRIEQQKITDQHNAWDTNEKN